MIPMGMNSHIFDISFEYLNLFSFMCGMTFAAFQSWYGRTAFKFIIGYLVALVIYLGTFKQNPTQPTPPPQKTEQKGWEVNPRTHVIQPRATHE